VVEVYEPRQPPRTAESPVQPVAVIVVVAVVVVAPLIVAALVNGNAPLGVIARVRSDREHG
jgi:hypothetical protein